jgi:hypothetical protein
MRISELGICGGSRRQARPSDKPRFGRSITLPRQPFGPQTTSKAYREYSSTTSCSLTTGAISSREGIRIIFP